MGFAQALEVLHATAQLLEPYTSSAQALPFPHLQRRLDQSLRGVALVASSSAAAALLTLALLPLAPFALPGWLALALLWLLLTAAVLVQLLARFALLPAPRPFLPDRASIHGVVQTLLCALFDATARLVQEPQLLVLLTLSVAHSWLWKFVLYAISTGSDADDDPLAAHFGAFVLVGGIVAFASLVSFEPSLVEDPFVLDPRAALFAGLARDVVRAARRGVVAWGVTHALLVLTQSDEPLFSLRFARAFFHVTSSAAESFVWLATASMFRLQLFRANHKSAASDGAVWDALAAPRRPVFQGAGFSMEELFTGGLAVNAQAGTPLGEQYVLALRKRVDGALKKISSQKLGANDTASLALENTEALDVLFKFANLLLVTKFDAEARRALFASEKRWHALVERTTAELDSFTLALQLLNAVPERKNQGDEKLIASLEKSVVHTASFVLSRSGANPLLLLDQHPHLANLRLPRAAIKSKVRYYVEAHAQFAVRRFLIEEARRRVFLWTKAVFSAQEVLCHLTSASRAEDAQGFAQHAVPAILTSLVECRKALGGFLETCLKNGSATDVYMQEADALARGIDKGIYRITNTFYGELETFAFSSEVKSSLQPYAASSV